MGMRNDKMDFANFCEWVFLSVARVEESFFNVHNLDPRRWMMKIKGRWVKIVP